MTRKTDPSATPDGEALWRDVTRTVRPLRRSAPPAPRLHASAAKAPPPVRAVVHAHPAPAVPVTPARPKVRAPIADRSPEKRIRRGRVDYAGKLDLHGMTQAEAQAALGRFVEHHRAEGARSVLVVTGKGRGERGGVLRAALPGWLERLRPVVTGYAAAHAKHGGGGAWYVFLRARD